MLNYPNQAGHKEPGATSEAAAEAIEKKGKARTLRADVLELLDQWEWDGITRCEFGGGPIPSKRAMTADEIAEFLEESILSVRPRLSELFAQGLVEKTGQRRPSSTGTMMHVWRLVRD